jgi:hypothetical protein
MVTSGTVGQTVFNTGRLVDRAYRIAKVPPQLVASEMLRVALDELYLILTSLANEGVPLWSITQYIVPLQWGVPTVTLDVGVLDVLNANIRTVSRLTGTASSSEGTAGNAFDGDLDTSCTEVAVAGNIALELDNDTEVTTVGILPNATGTWSIALQYSDDGVTWVTFYADTLFAAVDREWQWLDFSGMPAKSFWRLLGVGTTVLNVRELAFCNNPSEIPMARVNKDDYSSLPDKLFKGMPLQYWFNRQLPQVEMKIWPTPDTSSQFRQIVVFAHRDIQDVGALQQSIEMPPRWFDAVSQKLGMYLAKVTPEAKANPADLKDDMNEAWSKAWMEERDASPFNLAPDISMYTR